LNKFFVIKGDKTMAEDTLFSKIIRHDIPSDIRYQDNDVTVFADIAPKAKIHLLIVPTKVIATVNDIEENDALLIGKMVLVAKKMAKDLGIAENGYRLIINCGKDGGQEVPHLHMHLLGGEQLKGLGF
jgi:histidine triad (HIT) family protein